LLTILAASCGPAATRSAKMPGTAPVGVVPTKAVDPRVAARATVTQLVHAQDDALRAGDYAKMVSAFSDDAVVLGPRAEQLAIGRDAAVKLLEGDAKLAADLKDTITWTPGAVSIGVAADARAAWVLETIDQKIDGPDARATVLRMTELVAEDDKSAWHVVAAAWSVGAQPGPLPADELPDLGTAVPGDAEKIASTFKDGIREDPRAWLMGMAEEPEAQLIGPFTDEIARAGGDVQHLVELSVFANAKGYPIGGARAGLAPSGSVGFVLQNVDARLEAKQAQKNPDRHMRALAVYEKRGDVWKPVQVHLSAGFPHD
jgi:ketosteroid isomerase-like protein